MPQANLSPREELLQIQKRIFAHNNEVIRSQALVRERGFDLYERRYKRHVKSYQRVSTQEELVEAILESDIIYLGDYHTNKQSQRTLLRILKWIVEKVPSLGIGLELVQRRHQKYLEAYLTGQLTEEAFLGKIQFKKYWYFDLWENFKPIFDFSRFHRIPLFAIERSLEADATLEKRDRWSAEIIASVAERNPSLKLIVFVGDLHAAPEHLPREVARELKARGIRKKELIIYQNSESIYWELAEDEVEEMVEIVKISDREFCVINTPPIVWQQSYLNWLEHEEGAIDYTDAKHSFVELLRRIAGFLGIEVTQEMEEEVEVFTCGDLSFLKRLSEDGDFSKREIQRIKKQILASESYFISEKKYVYLANLSINHASEEAAHYLKFLCSGAERPRDPVDAFYANTIHEALGFFGSKIINHKRKCFHEKEYLGLINYIRSNRVPQAKVLEMEMALLILKHKELEKKGIPIHSQKYFKARHDLFFGVTHGLGYMLGDRLYYAFLAEKVTKEEIRDLFCGPMKGEGEPFEIYKRLLRKVRGVKIPKRV
jgi:hypothetical protein